MGIEPTTFSLGSSIYCNDCNGLDVKPCPKMPFVLNGLQNACKTIQRFLIKKGVIGIRQVQRELRAAHAAVTTSSTLRPIWSAVAGSAAF